MEWMKHGYNIVLTGQVYEELQENNETIQEVDAEIKKGDIKVINMINEECFQKFKNRHPILGKGEISVILTAIELNAQNKKYYAIIDDKKARIVANEYHVNLTGTYGLLKTLLMKGYLTQNQFDECKNDIKNSKFRIDLNKIK